MPASADAVEQLRGLLPEKIDAEEEAALRKLQDKSRSLREQSPLVIKGEPVHR